MIGQIVASFARVYSSMAKRKINVVNNVNEFDDIVSSLFNYVDYINSKDDIMASNIDGVLYKDIVVIDELVPFIYPKAVRFIGSDVLSKDILCRDYSTVPEGFKFDAMDFLTLQARFRSFFKKDIKSDIKTLDEIKKVVSLSDVQELVVVQTSTGWNGHYNDSAHVPLPVKVYQDFFEESYFCEDLASIITNYFLNIKE